MKPTPTYANKPTSDNPRDVEAWALAEASRRLLDAGRSPVNEETLRAALQLNQRLWTIFQAAMTEDDCGHPPEVRTNIAALSLLVDRETMARLVDLDVSKLDTLISINRSVASGLTARPDTVAPGQPAPAAQAARPPMAPPMAPPVAAPDGQPPRQSLRISI
ncbi:hypothetical protein GAY29_15755 [Azospirillum brasilense]|uniref:flagellar biosynthesis regulator FlaF n=1 Tax=Azospirillum brasilense TaxID=192 RepID=UPI00190BA381|nr:flagellar biosynthesis regulator FlaF [Azospirillum brasilense]MBK3734529.1 hypothetical protein [Azospirillum brasilense]